MNTIHEEESFESVTSLQNSSGYFTETKSKGTFGQTEEFTNYEDSEDNFHQTESLNYETTKSNPRKETFRSDSSGKASSGTNEAFPMLVRGLDFESDSIKFSVSAKSDSESYLNPNVIRKYNSFSNDSGRSVRLDSDLLSSDIDDRLNKSNLSLEESFASMSQASNVFAFRSGMLENLDKLKKTAVGEVSWKEFFSEEEDSKEGFWEKLGFKDKKKQKHWIGIALSEWEATTEELKSKKKETKYLKSKMDALEKKKEKSFQEQNNLEIEIGSFKKKIHEERVKHEQKTEAINNEIEKQKQKLAELKSYLQENHEWYQDLNLSDLERRERWSMRIEDLRVTLYKTCSENSQAKEKALKNENYLKFIGHEKKKQDLNKLKIKECIKLLQETSEFMESYKSHSQFSEEFYEILQDLKDTNLETMSAIDGFKQQAYEDPKKALPYIRASEKIFGNPTHF